MRKKCIDGTYEHKHCEDILHKGEMLVVCHDCETTLGRKCEVYSRVCGYLRPTQGWNPGKKSEFEERVPFIMPVFMKHIKLRGLFLQPFPNLVFQFDEQSLILPTDFACVMVVRRCLTPVLHGHGTVTKIPAQRSERLMFAKVCLQNTLVLRELFDGILKSGWDHPNRSLIFTSFNTVRLSIAKYEKT